MVTNVLKHGPSAALLRPLQGSFLVVSAGHIMKSQHRVVILESHSSGQVKIKKILTSHLQFSELYHRHSSQKEVNTSELGDTLLLLWDQTLSLWDRDILRSQIQKFTIPVLQNYKMSLSNFTIISLKKIQ